MGGWMDGWMYFSSFGFPLSVTVKHHVKARFFFIKKYLDLTTFASVYCNLVLYEVFAES